MLNDEKNQALSRRSLIKSIGGLAVSWPLMRSLAQAQSAQDTGPLKRLVLICGESGSSSVWWRPQGTENDFNIEFDGAVLKPLAPLRSKLLIINGIGNYAASFKGVESHEVRSVTFTAWANSKPGDPSYARGPSVDRGIIEKLREPRPLYASIASPVSGFGSEYYYAQAGYPISGVGTLSGIYDALFANLPGQLPSGGSPDSSQALRKKYYDQQLADATVLRSRLGPDARLKLDEYLTTLQEKLKDVSGTPANQIGFPNKPAGNPDYSKTVPVMGPYDTYNRELDLVADGLALGVTQVACIRLHHGIIEDSFNGQMIDTFNSSGQRTGQIPITDFHQNVAHAQGVGDQFANLTPNLHCRDVHNAQSKIIARFLQRLDTSRDRDGTSVLDNTLVVWTTQLGDQASHLSGRLPYVLAGGLGEKMGTFRMGRYLDFAPNSIKGINDLWADRCQVASNVVLNSVQKTFGINQDYFGENLDPAKCRGYLPRAT